ncbi:hypothetical protein BASA50_009845 [Batrachochytrium salamandrivorans]|uniref:SNRNP25 ubiquitin-like domain-containing protein n=1 Tax=Batrachochytrium salamandrivorans TaxID=1357716 RepID=A0ABQ8F1B0_9FUNG|nr:hypothetical protein BASA50_009845 [Batrachochytrium salamandrivorans]KAH9271076.1 hypothetical protein BASA83_006829 [Batrachochytrium salamandrivorans]
MDCSERALDESLQRIKRLYLELLSDPCLEGRVHPDSSLDELRSLLAERKGATWTLTLQRFNLEPLAIIVRPTQTLWDLKKAVQRAWTRLHTRSREETSDQQSGSDLHRQPLSHHVAESEYLRRGINWHGIWKTHTLALLTHSVDVADGHIPAASADSAASSSTATMLHDHYHASHISKVFSNDRLQLNRLGLSDGSQLRFVRIRRVKPDAAQNIKSQHHRPAEQHRQTKAHGRSTMIDAPCYTDAPGSLVSTSKRHSSDQSPCIQPMQSHYQSDLPQPMHVHTHSLPMYSGSTHHSDPSYMHRMHLPLSNALLPKSQPLFRPPHPRVSMPAAMLPPQYNWQFGSQALNPNSQSYLRNRPIFHSSPIPPPPPPCAYPLYNQSLPPPPPPPNE